jgi:methionyl-tRNA formyltransferase
MNVLNSLCIVFLGTPDFAVPALKRIATGPDHVALVVTQPDKPVGRGQRLTPPPLKQCADELGIPSIQPATLKPDEVYQRLLDAHPDLMVVAAYGKILRPRYLQLARLGCINVHASLLPRWRGAAPINWSILGGDHTSGVTIMQVEPELDSGPILRQWETEIGQTETAGELHDRLAIGGAEVLAEVLSAYREARPPVPIAQDPARVTWAKMLSKDDGVPDFWRDPASVAAHINGMSPWPGAVCSTPRGPLKLCRARVAPDLPGDAPPGTVIQAASHGGITIAVKGGAIQLLQCQRPGKQVVDAEGLVCGLHASIVGERWIGREAPGDGPRTP